MQFCSECHNMYYLKIQDEDGNIGNTLIYYCRNCGHEDKTLSTTNICVSDIQLRSSEKKYTHIVNEYTKYDPTLPRINTIKCPNQDCRSNKHGMQSGGGEPKAKSETSKIQSAAKKAEKSAIKAQKSAAQAQASVAVAEANLEAILEQEQAEQAQAEQAQAEQAQVEQQEQAQAEQQKQAEHQDNKREVIYIRYDDTNMKYVYLCVHCDMTWRTDNRL